MVLIVAHLLQGYKLWYRFWYRNGAVFAVFAVTVDCGTPITRAPVLQVVVPLLQWYNAMVPEWCFGWWQQ